MAQLTLLRPDWDCAPGIELRLSSRQFGKSTGPYSSLNLGNHVNDTPAIVRENRALVTSELPGEPLWLDQVHGDTVLEAGPTDLPQQPMPAPVADASFTRQSGFVLAIMVADCLPIALSSRDGQELAVVHAGWRGLANGILERATEKFRSTDLQAWLGPAIGPCHYEVDSHVRDAFPDEAGFHPGKDSQHWMMNLCQQARSQLLKLGVESVTESGICTACDDRFYSHRQMAPTGRFGVFLWKSS